QSISDIDAVFAIGVDKVSINSAAIKNTLFIEEASAHFGSERIVLSMDVKSLGPGEWAIYERGGKMNTGMDAIEWAVQGARLGAGEIVVNRDRKSTRLNSSHVSISYAVFCLKKK